ncbi:MAG: DNA polymerase III subunit delta [Rhodobacterales bacterium RIFCSPHIGHO2_02_FULL_62_130]|jgi:DNA polymerase-3 subunit delta|nr:MAG: DNA polymerase III subunit delta [Rhodobacterales bacterium RIFCSPHIGHO2_12_FULL_62_75]OHC59617.1 MAG: DNA polymerase III subunit delta [Rhodobacterales bacterium RIFCSPHIGHO2_02_FULL_62_130]
MKLAGAEASRFLAKPDPTRAGLLIFGADTMRVALKRQEAILALIGPQGESEMRLARIQAADLRKDAALLSDATRAVGFFPGPRVAFVEDATDGLTGTLESALKDWRAGDAQIVVTAGNLTAKSALKTLFEKHLNATSIGLYDDPPSREEIESALAKAGLTRIEPAAMADLTSLARDLDPGDFRQMLDKIALYKYQDPSPLTPTEIAALAPATIEAEVDDLLAAVADQRHAVIGPLMRRLEGQGVLPVTLCIGALRHFRSLHVAASDPGGVSNGIMKARIFGPRRDAMQRQAQTWGMRKLEDALALLVETDLSLRSTSRAPAMAVMERALIRLAMMRR